MIHSNTMGPWGRWWFGFEHFHVFSINRPRSRISTNPRRRVDLILIVSFQETDSGPNSFQERQTIFFGLSSLLQVKHFSNRSLVQPTPYVAVEDEYTPFVASSNLRFSLAKTWPGYKSPDGLSSFKRNRQLKSFTRYKVQKMLVQFETLHSCTCLSMSCVD